MQDSLVRPIEVVSASDPALDMSASERRAYAESRDPSKIREVPGQRAVRYLARPLSVVDASVIDQRPSISDRVVWAFLLGCSEIHHADASGPRDGSRLVPTRSFDAQDRKRMIWSDDELGAIQESFGRAVLYEIGGVIYERTLRGKAAGGSVPYTVPQSLLDELAVIEARQHAERRQREHEATSTT